MREVLVTEDDLGGRPALAEDVVLSGRHGHHFVDAELLHARQIVKVPEGAGDLAVARARGYEVAVFRVGPGVAVLRPANVHPLSMDGGVGRARGHDAPVDLVKARVKGVPGVAVLVEDPVAELGPLLDEHLRGVAPGLPGVVPRLQEVEREVGEVSWVAAASTLLGKGAGPIDGVRPAHHDLGGAIGDVTLGGVYHSLAHAVSPRPRDDDGGRLEVDPLVQGLMKGVGAFGEQFLQK